MNSSRKGKKPIQILLTKEQHEGLRKLMAAYDIGTYKDLLALCLADETQAVLPQAKATFLLLSEIRTYMKEMATKDGVSAETQAEIMRLCKQISDALTTLKKCRLTPKDSEKIFDLLGLLSSWDGIDCDPDDWS